MADSKSPMKPTTNYFISTLGEAAECNAQAPHRFKTINQFIDQQSREIPLRPAVAFPVPHTHRDQVGEEWGYDLFTYSDLRRQSLSTAKALSIAILESTSHYNGDPTVPAGTTVALLCPSSVEFLFAWLGLMRLGYAVLMIAWVHPGSCRVAPSAIAHLCKTCNVTLLFYDEIYESLAKASAEQETHDSSIRSICLQELGIRSSIRALADSPHADKLDEYPFAGSATEHDIAYFHHTSGTSTGLPKPIPQSHHCAVGVLPLLDSSNKATFSTTPLSHAGSEDCFRAWTSGAFIWLFPGKDVPITTSNILNSLECAQKATRKFSAPPVKYFTSVPYILRMVTEDKSGLRTIQGMDLVGVGGAALPTTVGDELVQSNVNLVSRFGSSECGFLMSSHRDYSLDKEWQYLRNRGSVPLRFEPQGNELSELVVPSDWPHMAKRNREDGSFATSDLFESHPTIANAWKYHSRADSQLALVTGKKFDPAPLEDAIATSALLSDVLIFGNGKEYPGALLFPSGDSNYYPRDQILNEIWPLIEKLNAEGQGHTKLSKPMLVLMPSGAPRPEKSSKGTVMRGPAEIRYEAEISQAYQTRHTDQEVLVQVPDEKVPVAILDIIKGVLNNEEIIPADADLFAFGVDSVACMEIRSLIQREFLARHESELPLNFVYDCGTINRLSQCILNIRNGRRIEEQDEIQLMQSLVHKYTLFDSSSFVDTHCTKSSITDQYELHNEPTIVLTGATGALGSHLLDLLRSSSRYRIVCLVRASSPEAARDRVVKSLLQRQKLPFDGSDPILCLPTKFSEPNLGLDPEVYASLIRSTTLIIHAAWAVNFSMRLRSFENDHIAGLYNLINLALQSPRPNPPRFLFCSSIATVLGQPSLKPVPETVSYEPLTASTLGYSRSKWVAEAICSHAHLTTEMHGRIAILRIGQLCGDTQSGIWNMSEAWPLMLSSLTVTKCLPWLENESLSWLPVDLAAQAVLEIAASPVLINTTQHRSFYSMDEDQEANDVPVFHIINPDIETKWSDLLLWLPAISPEMMKHIAIVDPQVWLDCLERAETAHPAKKLLGLWRATYCGSDPAAAAAEDDIPSAAATIARVFEMKQTKTVAPVVMGSVLPIDEELFEKIWSWLCREMDALSSTDKK